MGDMEYACLTCTGKPCGKEMGERPDRCTEKAVSEAIHDEVAARYREPENHRMMKAAVMTSVRCRDLTRVQETMEFACRIGAKRLGIATCTMLLSESRTLARVLEEAGFEGFGVACKVESNHRSDLDLMLDDGVEGPVLCNPLMQARLLEEAGTDLNIVMGLCVGHDALFCKYSHAPVTTLVTKDHITGHNACVALHESKSVYRLRLEETIGTCRSGELSVC